MGSRNTPCDSHPRLLDKTAADGNIYRKIVLFVSYCLLSLANSLKLFFRFIAGHVLRSKKAISESRELKQDMNSMEKGEDFMLENIEKRMPAFSFKFQNQNFEDEHRKKEEEEEEVEQKGTTTVTAEKKDKPSVTAADVRNCRFLSEKDFSGFMEEPETMNFRVHESFIGFEEENFDEGNMDMGFLSAEDFMKPKMEFVSEEDGNSDDYTALSSLYKQRRPEDVMDLKYCLYGEEKSNSISSDINSVGEREVRFIPEEFSDFEFDSDTESSSDGYSVKELICDSDIDGFLSDRDFGEREHDSKNSEISLNFINKVEQGQRESFFLERSDDDGDDEDDGDHHHPNDDEGIEEEISPEKKMNMGSHPEETSAENELTVRHETKLGLDEREKNYLMEAGNSSDTALPSKKALQIEFIEDSSDEELSSVKNGSTRLNSFEEVSSVKDITDPEQKAEIFDREEVKMIADDSSYHDFTNSTNASQGTEPKTEDHDAFIEPQVVKQKIEESKTYNFDSEDLDELWEHQDLIEQLKIELKKVRAVGLPTILEESESPKTMDDLRPFKIDEKFLCEDPMDELQKFYKSYRERMRKFDILNYQKMYAMGFLQLKNPLHSMGTQKPLLSTIMSHLSQNIIPFCQKKTNDDPSEKLIKDLQCDLETVYVGQTCLSWEFLRWQYEKSCELPESDPHRSHQYNQVAGEFQQFQVLVQRFTENERFQGPRLPNYVKQRCVLRNLLQVPVMKEDCLKDNMEKKDSNYAITSEMLEDIMEETIRVFWEFVKADKRETPIFIKGLIENTVEVQDPSDYEFMADIQANLEKKEKKLKDLLRTGNCLVKKFKKPKEDRSNQDLFFSQVDLKLVSRVLKMSRITSDQLIWCHKKISKITFSERKVHRETSFLLFPC